MPSQTPRQHRAMEAAAHGHSTLGIPKSVGKEFVAADKPHKPPHRTSGHMVDRKKAGLTHQQVAKEFGVSQSTARRRQAALGPVTTGQAAGSMGSTKGAQPLGYKPLGSAK